MYRNFAQFIAVSSLGVRTLPARLGSALMTLVGIAGVVAALSVVFSIAEGLETVMNVTGSHNSVVIMQTGADFELASSLELEQVGAMKQAPGLDRDGQGPILSGEVVVVVDIPKTTTGTDAHIPLRGLEPAGYLVREGFRMVEGRRPEPGTRELIAGLSLAAQYDGLAVGATKHWGDVEWAVVGLFEADGSVAESELWGDVRVLQSIYGYGSGFNSVHAKLDSADALPLLKEALDADVRTPVSVETYKDFYGKQAESLTSLLRLVGGTAGFLMAICATFGALNTMYASVSARTREIATLRALGFDAAPTVVSVLIESLVIAAIGGAIGIAAAYIGFNGLQTSTMNWATYTQVGFSFVIDREIALQGMAYALGIGLVGGLLPAARAANLAVAVALREA